MSTWFILHHRTAVYTIMSSTEPGINSFVPGHRALYWRNTWCFFVSSVFRLMHHAYNSIEKLPPCTKEFEDSQNLSEIAQRALNILKSMYQVGSPSIDDCSQVCYHTESSRIIACSEVCSCRRLGEPILKFMYCVECLKRTPCPLVYAVLVCRQSNKNFCSQVYVLYRKSGEYCLFSSV